MQDDNLQKQEVSEGRINGRFAPGVSGNPNGRPKQVSITDGIKRMLKECPEGSQKTYLDLMLSKIFIKALNESDFQTIKLIWNYVDDMPKQGSELNVKVLEATNVNLNKYSEDELRTIIELAKRNEPEIGTVEEKTS